VHNKPGSVNRWVLSSGAALLAVILVSPGVAQKDVSDGDPVAPWELASSKPGDASWAPLLRMRAAESDYRDTPWWNQYKQMRAQLEATAGNHAAALHYWDPTPASRDSVGVLPEGVRAVDALEYVATVAGTARVIMINERHHAASDRLLTLRLLSILRKKGFRYFAAETFSNRDTTLNERTYPVKGMGVYTDETVFAEVVREALRLGYTLVPYEQTAEQREVESSLAPQQRRDRAQAQNLQDGIFRDDPDAKVLVHAGFGHILEEASERWHPMAVYFREITGIDPVTVDQTKLSERSTPAHEHPAYRAAIGEGLLTGDSVVLLDASGQPFSPAEYAVDIQVLTPRTSYALGRPDWMTLGGRRVGVEIEVPECRNRRCYVEARVASEPPDAIPLDRAEVIDAETVRLFLPPGETIVLSVFAESGEPLRTDEYVVPRAGQ
jgi:hypothetical protein